jgi:exodeoxyribonuclease VII large subunit
MAQALTTRGQRLRDLARALPRPEALLESARQRLDLAALTLAPALRARAQTARARADRAGAALTPALDRAVARHRLSFGHQAARLTPARLTGLTRQGQRDLDRLDQRLDPARIAARTAQARARFDDLGRQFDRAARATTARHRARLDALARLHQSLGYTETLRRGYAVVRAGKKIVTGQGQAAKAATLEIEFADGRLTVTPDTGAPAPKPRAKRDPSKDQGSLF